MEHETLRHEITVEETSRPHKKANLKGKVFQPVIWKSVKNEYEKLAKIKTKYSNL